MYNLKLPLGGSDSSLLFTSHTRTIELDCTVTHGVTQTAVHRPLASALPGSL